MRVSVIQADGVVVVDGVGRKVNLSALDTRIHAIHWRDDHGVVEYDQDAVESVTVRDFEAERAAAQEAIRRNQPVPTEPLHKAVVVRMEPRGFTNFELIRPYYDGWAAAAPVLPPPPTPEEIAAQQAEAARLATIDQEIIGVTLGTATPTTRDQLKAMTRAELRAWYDANILEAADLRRLVRWMFFLLVRRIF